MKFKQTIYDRDELKDIESAMKKGDLVFTPPKELHATYFPIKTTLLVASKNKRDKKTYEKDTIREKLIDFENIKSIKKHAKKIK